MIKIIESNKLFGTKKHYELIQGDSFTFRAREIHVPQDKLVSKAIFRLSDKDFCKEFEKEFVKNEQNDWLLFVTATETEQFTTGNHLSEIEVVFIDGGKDTIEQCDFIVKNQIKECSSNDR